MGKVLTWGTIILLLSVVLLASSYNGLVAINMTKKMVILEGQNLSIIEELKSLAKKVEALKMLETQIESLAKKVEALKMLETQIESLEKRNVFLEDFYGGGYLEDFIVKQLTLEGNPLEIDNYAVMPVIIVPGGYQTEFELKRIEFLTLLTRMTAQSQAWFQRESGRTFRVTQPIIHFSDYPLQELVEMDGFIGTGSVFNAWREYLNLHDYSAPRNKIIFFYIFGYEKEFAYAFDLEGPTSAVVMSGPLDASFRLLKEGDLKVRSLNYQIKLGGLTHELGHAFGLRDSSDYQSIMSAAFYRFPKVSLSEEEKEALSRSPYLE